MKPLNVILSAIALGIIVGGFTVTTAMRHRLPHHPEPAPVATPPPAPQDLIPDPPATADPTPPEPIASASASPRRLPCARPAPAICRKTPQGGCAPIPVRP